LSKFLTDLFLGDFLFVEFFEVSIAHKDFLFKTFSHFVYDGISKHVDGKDIFYFGELKVCDNPSDTFLKSSNLLSWFSLKFMWKRFGSPGTGVLILAKLFFRRCNLVRFGSSSRERKSVSSFSAR
jgi:hypothetical protein